MIKKLGEKIRLGRKIIEQLITGKSANEISKKFNKSKESILVIRDKAIEYNYLEEIIPGEEKYKVGMYINNPLQILVFSKL